MTKKITVTVLDTTGIQPYIFGSNRLRENIGASYLAAQATGGWVTSILGRLLGNQVYIPGDNDPAETPAGKRIEMGEVRAELVYSGGGNTVLIFDELALAQRFVGLLTEQALRRAPGLTLVAAHRAFEWDDQPRLPKVVSGIMDAEIDRLKRERVPSAPLLGLGVTAACGSTGLPAVDMSGTYYKDVSDESYPISGEVVAKLTVFNDANDALAKDLDAARGRLPYDLDNLGRSEGTSSYVAVVHADGNGIGKHFIDAGKDPYCSNRDYITAIRRLSGDVRKVGSKALRDLYTDLRACIEEVGPTEAYFTVTQGDRRIRQFRLGQQRDRKDRQKRAGNWYMPFRPLVYGGDDVTFVCDGRIGLGLAARYMTLFERQRLADGASFTACAGVAIVKTHYPFARAYALSESLCASAKKRVRQEAPDKAFSALDWHIASAGPTSGIEEIREREYRVPAGDLHLRPVRLVQSEDDWRTWPAFREVVRSFVEDDVWRGKRNKVITLREALRQGGGETEQFLHAYELLPAGSAQGRNAGADQPRRATGTGLPRFSGGAKSGAGDTLRRKGWFGEICGYFDPIEAMEFSVDPWTAMENPR